MFALAVSLIWCTWMVCDTWKQVKGVAGQSVDQPEAEG